MTDCNTNQNNIFACIACANKHNIEIKPGRKNVAAENCCYESVIYNINVRPCFREKLTMTLDYYRKSICRTLFGRRILKYNTNQSIVSTGHDHITVVSPKDYSG